jgi:hypothetical protein
MLHPGIPEKAIKSLSVRNKRDLENNKQDLVKRIGYPDYFRHEMRAEI